MPNMHAIGVSKRANSMLDLCHENDPKKDLRYDHHSPKGMPFMCMRMCR